MGVISTEGFCIRLSLQLPSPGLAMLVILGDNDKTDSGHPFHVVRDSSSSSVSLSPCTISVVGGSPLIIPENRFI